MKIQFKLFFAFLLGSLVLVSVMYALLQWSFDRGMLDYVNQRELNAQVSLAEALAGRYEGHGSWDFIRNNHALWRQLLTTANADASENSPADRHRFRPPPPGGRRPEPHKRPDQGKSPHGPPPKTHRLILLDDNQQAIFGHYIPNQETPLLPITVAGTEVGWLTIAPRENITKAFDVSFVKQQQTTFLIISGLLLFLSACVAYPLAVLLTRPIKQLASATHQLASGHYQLHVEYESRDELGQLTQDFNHLANTLAANETARKRWVADISHELRTPLAITRGELEAMLDGIRPIDHNTIQSTHQEVLHLQRLVDDLYELTNADIGALNYQLESVDIIEVVSEQVAKLSQTAQQANLDLSANLAQGKLLIEADKTRLTQLFHNLITNSIKYTDPGGDIRLTVTQEAESIRIEMIDSSPGVPKRHLENLFDPLFRVESSRNRQTGGSGLGLAICKRIVEGHHGTIKASESELGGLKMTIHLPI